LKPVYKISFGMSEVLVLGSFLLYSQNFAFSMTLFGLGLFGKFMAYSMEIQAQKQAAESGEKTIKSITDTITNAVALGSIGGTTKSGKFH
tara:strand:- start:299 stop:568 length:270 start_codon:yes stop_codon:yes gene_type:complete